MPQLNVGGAPDKTASFRAAFASSWAAAAAFAALLAAAAVEPRVLVMWFGIGALAGASLSGST